MFHQFYKPNRNRKEFDMLLQSFFSAFLTQSQAANFRDLSFYLSRLGKNIYELSHFVDDSQKAAIDALMNLSKYALWKLRHESSAEKSSGYKTIMALDAIHQNATFEYLLNPVSIRTQPNPQNMQRTKEYWAQIKRQLERDVIPSKIASTLKLSAHVIFIFGAFSIVDISMTIFFYALIGASTPAAGLLGLVLAGLLFAAMLFSVKSAECEARFLFNHQIKQIDNDLDRVCDLLLKIDKEAECGPDTPEEENVPKDLSEFHAFN